MKFFAVLALAGLAIAAPLPGPGKAVTSSAAASAAPSQACYNNACGGGYPWKRDTVDVVERAPEPVAEVIEARAAPGKPVTSSAAASAAPSQACYNNACGGGYPWKK